MQSEAIGKTCVICQSPFREGEPLGKCPGCGTVYHRECWQYNGGCGVYGCSKAAEVEKLTDLEIPAGYWGSDEKACPQCGSVIKAAALRCRQCGVVFETARPQSTGEFVERLVNTQSQPALKAQSIWLLVFSLISCTAPLAAVVGWAWYLSRRRQIAEAPTIVAALARIAVGVATAQAVLLTVFGVIYAAVQ